MLSGEGVRAGVEGRLSSLIFHGVVRGDEIQLYDKIFGFIEDVVQDLCGGSDFRNAELLQRIRNLDGEVQPNSYRAGGLRGASLRNRSYLEKIVITIRRKAKMQSWPFHAELR